jgi:DNA mismatch endonuclease (patch repair protein)
MMSTSHVRDRVHGASTVRGMGVSERMSRQATRDTGPEMALRRRLHALGLRYRVHRRPIPAVRRTADIVFTRHRIAIFVDGCFWHGCPEHGTSPKTNSDWWRTKLTRNAERDADTDRQLQAAGWTPIRIWEHEDSEAAADRIRAALAAVYSRHPTEHSIPGMTDQRVGCVGRSDDPTAPSSDRPTAQGA